MPSSVMDQVDRLPHRIPHDHKYLSRGDFDTTSNASTKRNSVLSNDTTLVASSIAGSDGKAPDKPSKPSSLKPIKEDILPEIKVVISDAKPPPRKKRSWLWISITVCVVIVVTIPILVVKLHRIHHHTLPSPTQTPVPTPTPAPPQIHIEGFNAQIWDNGNVQLFYGDVSGNILSAQKSQNVWSKPSVITSDARSGTTISLSIIIIDSSPDSIGDAGSVLWRVIYVDSNYVLHEKRKNVTFKASGYSEQAEMTNLAGSSGWVSGSLGSYGYKASDTLYQQVCTWNQNVTEATADAYLYFDSASGGMQKLGWFYNDTWVVLHDLPATISTANKAIECTASDRNLETLWLVNDGLIEQWWSFGERSGTWNQGLSYTGLVSTNSSIIGGHLDNFTNLYFQAPNNSIMQLTAWSTGPSTSFSPAVEVGIGLPGTRLAIDWTDDQTPTYSVYYQNSSGLVQQQMGVDNGTGMLIPVSPAIQILPGVALSGCILIGLSVWNISLVFCFMLVLWLHS